MSTYFMPFGKHKGEPLGEVPTDYLVWVHAKRIRNPPWLLGAVEAELQRRRNRDRYSSSPPPQQSQTTSGTSVQVADAVRRWFAKLALQYHPDRGGSVEAMRIVNQAHDLLKKELPC